MKRIGLLFILLRGTVLFAQDYLSTGEALHKYAGTIGLRTCWVFPVTREEPLQWPDSVKTQWLTSAHTGEPFTLHARPGEYFTFQTGVWALSKTLNQVQVRFSDLRPLKGPVIPAGTWTCFNTGGTDFRGHAFTQNVEVAGGQVQALWLGGSVPPTAYGAYEGTVTVTTMDVPAQRFKIKLIVQGTPLPDHGFDEGRSLSRLAWLNATTGTDSRVTKGFRPVGRQGNWLTIAGRSLQVGGDGLPSQIMTYFTASNQSISTVGSPISDKPFHFVIEQASGASIHLQPGRLRFLGRTPSSVSWEVTNTAPECDLVCQGELQFDGFVGYKLTVIAKKELQIKDIRLDIPVKDDKAAYMMGLNKPGGGRPSEWHWKWDTTKNQDALWLGAVNGGLRIRWKAENYRPPLVNIYYAFGPLRLPPSWGNEGRGGVEVAGEDGEVMLRAYSGARTMRTGDRLHYDFEMLITPFKTMNRSTQFGDRYYQSQQETSSVYLHQADSLGANIINVHQGNDIYPFINYPYSDLNRHELSSFIDAGHRDHRRVKVYYTTRELTVNLPELLPFMSLNGEIIYPGPGAGATTLLHPNGPDPWLKAYLRNRKYIPAWVSPMTSKRYAGFRDISVITTPDSRLNNFYVAGLDWMVRHMKIDGVYIDDCSLDRTTIARARKVLDDGRPAPRIDMHSWNHFNKEAGYASCLNLYMDLLPYIDRVWIGEARNYDTPPDYWLTEIAGIPFGLPGEMLQDGGNRWRGMVYGITNRAAWSGTPPDAIWRFWDQYALDKKTMTGYWDPANPVTIDNEAVKVTAYKGKDQTILALGNFSGLDQPCLLHIDYGKLGYKESDCSISMPAIENYQQAQLSVSLGHLNVPANKGYLIVIKNRSSKPVY